HCPAALALTLSTLAHVAAVDLAGRLPRAGKEAKRTGLAVGNLCCCGTTGPNKYGTGWSACCGPDRAPPKNIFSAPFVSTRGSAAWASDHIVCTRQRARLCASPRARDQAVRYRGCADRAAYPAAAWRR